MVIRVGRDSVDADTVRWLGRKFGGKVVWW